MSASVAAQACHPPDLSGRCRMSRVAQVRVHHPAIQSFIDHLIASDKATVVPGVSCMLGYFQSWLAARRVDLLDATSDTIAAYQQHLATDYRSPAGGKLALNSQAARILLLRSLYRWLYRRNILLFNPAASIIPAKVPKALTVAKDHLTLDEAIALISTLSDLVAEIRPQTVMWALAIRNLSAISLALATGRRRGGLVRIRLDDLNVDRCEVRVSREKGRVGRVLPVAAWTMRLITHYIAEARPLILRDRESDALFPSIREAYMTSMAFHALLDQAVAATIQRHPDLHGLREKRISSHSLRVTFATVMFSNGCGIRSLNEMMLHTSLNTTALYTPIPLEDLRRVLIAHHPRA